MVGLKDEALAVPRKWTRQRVREVLGKEADEFDQAIADPGVPIPGLHEALKTRGVTIQRGVLYAWRRDG